MVQSPELRRIDVIIRDIPTNYCRPSKKHKGIELCFDDKSNVTKYTYIPNIFSRAFNADIDKLKKIVEECEVCKTGDKLVMKLMNDVQDKNLSYSDKAYNFAIDFLTYLAEKYDVPIPETILGECPIGHTKTCYAFEHASPDTGTIYLHPEDLGPTAIAHEFYHYMATYKYGTDIGGNENNAISFAKKEVNETFPTGSYSLTYEYGKFGNEKEKVLNTQESMNFQVSDSMFEKIDRLYNWPSKFLKVPASALNEAWTPELIGTGIELGTKTMFTSFGAAIANLLGGLALIGAATTKYVTGRDKAFLHEIAAHMISRLAVLGNPSDFGIAIAQAKDFGRSFGMGDFGGVGNTIMKSFDSIKSDLEMAMGSFGRTFGGSFSPTVATVPIPSIGSTTGQLSQLFDIDLGISQA